MALIDFNRDGRDDLTSRCTFSFVEERNSSSGTVEELTLRWPSGQEQRFHDLPNYAEILILEREPNHYFA